MSDDLVTQLRAFASPAAEVLDDGYRLTKMCHQSHEAADNIEELEKALANMQREYDKRGDRIEELEAKLAKTLDALSSFRDFENSVFYGIYQEKNKRAAYRGVKRKFLAALKMLEENSHDLPALQP